MAFEDEDIFSMELNSGYPREERSDSREQFYKHQPLDPGTTSLRVIKVLPPDDDWRFIKCEIHHATTDSNYVCLSYVWGPPGDTSLIKIDGMLFSVRRNLLEFLGIASHKYVGKTLWIDALCIDQDNTLERNHQVKQMGQIYSNAEFVLSWLSSDMEIAQYLGSIKNLSHLNNEWAKKPSIKLAFNPYWSRAWITQEVLLAKNVILVIRLCSVFKEMGGSSFKKRPLIQNIQAFGMNQCSDPRDGIYSILSISEEGDAVEVDYSSHISTLVANVVHVSCETCICVWNTVLKTLHVKQHDFSSVSWELIDREIVDVQGMHSRVELRMAKQDQESGILYAKHLGDHIWEVPMAIYKSGAVFSIDCPHMVSKRVFYGYRDGELGYRCRGPLSSERGFLDVKSLYDISQCPHGWLIGDREITFSGGDEDHPPTLYLPVRIFCRLMILHRQAVSMPVHEEQSFCRDWLS
ncbi:HET-domain-containing protein [Corynespora cassiicola Philippines]|uniref:HET-domain-containing protein n=1 Tax=Corynespora cassiicola Philippines TaxID=1448308 RepID=A0A2T2NVC8_CORCC|nr:HET-domain-containing protein [Corynespora cassiicola Philippines]